jgi:DnaK suppressor protein
MDIDRARHLLLAERARIRGLLASSAKARAEDNDAERDAGDGDADGAQPLEHEALDVAIASSLRERLAAVDRADERLANGIYGFSVESGLPIPDDRLEADPAAELTVAEAAKYKHRHERQPRSATGF